jgi:VWA domain-containing protein
MPATTAPASGVRRRPRRAQLVTLTVACLLAPAAITSFPQSRSWAATGRDGTACDQISQPSTTPSNLTTLLDATPPQADAERAAVATDTIAVVDLSGSTFGPNGTDPTGERFRAVRALIGVIASLRDGLADRFGIVLFGSDAPPEASTGLALLPSGTSLLNSKLDQPTNMGNTNFAAAIHRAATSFQTTSRGRARNLVIVTDGLPDLGDGRPPQALLPDIAAALHELPGDVHTHLLVVGDDTTWNQAETLWSGLGLATIDRLRDTSDLLAKYLDLLRPDLGLERLYAGPSPKNGTRNIPVTPLTDRLAVTALSLQPDMSSTLISPAGQRQGVRHNDNGVTVLTTSNPAAGTWTAQGLPPGVLVIERSPLQIRVQQLTATVPYGRAQVPELMIQTAQGYRPTQIPPGLPHQITGSINAPGTTPERLVTFRSDRPGHWAVTQPIRTPSSGTYILTLRLDSRATPSQPPVRYTVGAEPYLDIQQPRTSLNAGGAITVATNLRLGHTRWHAPAGTQLEAELRNQAGRILDQIPLQVGPGGSSARGQFTTSAQGGCSYAIRIAMRTRDGTTDTWISQTLRAA